MRIQLLCAATAEPIGATRLRFEKEVNNQNRTLARPNPHWLIQLIFYAGLSLTFGAVLAIYFAGDRTWWGTAILFGPRWIWAIPLGIALLVTPRMGRIPKGLSILGLACFVFLILGFNLPVGRLIGSGNVSLRIMTLNVGIDRARWNELGKLIRDQRIDILVLQECRNPPDDLVPPNWHSVHAGELFILSRYPIAQTGIVTRALSHRYPRPIALIGSIDSPFGTFPLATLHMLSPSQGLQQLLSAITLIDVSRKGTLEQEIIWRRMENLHASGGLQNYSEDLIIAGDFNTPVESTIYRQAWGRYGNAFSQAGIGIGQTVSFQRRNFSFSCRVDHVLLGSNWRAGAAWVGPDVGSDHRPVIAELRRTGAVQHLR